MLLKEKYNLNYLRKHKRFMLLRENPFVPGKYKPTLNFNKMTNQKNAKCSQDKMHKLNRNSLGLFRFSTNVIKYLDSLLNINKYSSLDNYQRFKCKQIDTRFRSIVSDQKRRTFFAKNELKNTVLKVILYANQKSFLFTRRIAYPSFHHKPGSLPLIFQKTKLTRILNRSLPLLKTGISTKMLKTKSIFEVNPFKTQNTNNEYVKLGPILFLEKIINPLFTEKSKAFSRIRNRCLLSGRSSIVGKYRLSRICFRHYANCGRVPELTKNKK